jgi:hypothetical protein
MGFDWSGVRDGRKVCGKYEGDLFTEPDDPGRFYWRLWHIVDGQPDRLVVAGPLPRGLSEEGAKVASVARIAEYFEACRAEASAALYAEFERWLVRAGLEPGSGGSQVLLNSGPWQDWRVRLGGGGV